MISSNVAFIGDDHPFDSSSRTVQDHAVNDPAKTVLEGDNLVGFGVIVLGNVRIGRGAIIGAGSLVINDVERNTINVGRPAKAIGRRRA